MPSIAPIVHKVVGNDHEETERDRSSPFRKEEVGIVRGRQHCQQQGGQGAGGGNMVKTSELLLNIVSWNRLKLLISLTRNMGTKLRYSSVAMGIHGSQSFRRKGRV